MAYSSEVVFPLGQGSATGYLFASSQTFGSLFGLSSTKIITFLPETSSQNWTVLVFMGSHCGFLLLAFIIALFTKNLLKRTEF